MKTIPHSHYLIKRGIIFKRWTNLRTKLLKKNIKIILIENNSKLFKMIGKKEISKKIIILSFVKKVSEKVNEACQYIWRQHNSVIKVEEKVDSTD